MKNTKRILFLLVTILLQTSVATANQNPPKTILEANFFGKGMVLVHGEHPYLRVFDDGQVEYGDVPPEGTGMDYLIRRAKLSTSELKSLFTFLNSAGVRNLASNYPPIEKPIDHLLRLAVTITRDTQSQIVVVDNFWVTSPKSKNDYPKGLIGLMCRIEKMRIDAYFRAANEPKRLCSS
jgi:hypothetical protein